MARTVQIELDVQDAKAVAAWQRSRDSIAQFHKQLDGVENSNKKNQSSAAGFFGEVRRGIGATATAITGITGVVGGMLAVVQQLRAEYDNIVQRQRTAADATKSFEQNLAQAVRNATGIFSAQETKALSLDLATTAGIDPARAASLVGSALTSTGVQNEADARLAIAAAGAAARFAPDLDQMGIEATAGVAASLAKKNKVSPQAAIGFIQRVGTQANVRELDPLVQNVAPGISGLQMLGMNEGQAGSLIATITQMTDDISGKKSTTGAVNFVDSLRERFRDMPEYQTGGQFDPMKAITALQADADLRRRFFDGGKFGGKSFGKPSVGEGTVPTAIESILTPGSKAGGAEQFLGGIGSIGTFAEGQQTYDSLVSDIRSVTPVSRAARSIEAGTARIAATSPEALSGVLRDNLEALQRQAGTSSMAQRLSKLMFEVNSDFGTSPEGALNTAVGGLQSIRDDLLTEQKARTITTGYGQFTTIPGRTPSPRDRSVASEIDATIAELRDLLKDLKRDGVKADVAVNVNGNGQPSATPPARVEALGSR